MAPSQTKAVIVKARGEAAIETIPTPKLRDDYILVKTTAVGLNPTDWKHVHWQWPGDLVGVRVGCDYAGIVEEVGSKVTKPFKKGDRIAGVVHGSNQSNKEDGAFAEYIVAKGDIAIPTPDNLSDAEAATLGIGITTVGQALYQSLKLSLPNKPLSTPEPVLIYGGSTATGILAIQFAKASGYTVYTTSSPKNFDYLRSLGADRVFDYGSASCARDIKAASGGKLRLAMDCISSAETTKIAVGSLSDEGGAYTSLIPVADDAIKAVNPKVSNGLTVAYTALGEAYDKWGPSPAKPDDYAFAKSFWDLARGLLADGKVKVARPIVNEGGKGLEGVLVGLEEMRQGKVSAGKLVYTL